MQRRRKVLLVTAVTVALAAGCLRWDTWPDGRQGDTDVLFVTDYEAADTARDAWGHVQAPSVGVEVQDGRIAIVRSPTSDDSVLRVELRKGDVHESSGYVANRAEVYDRHADPGSTPPEQWPDPVGSVRWYDFALYLPADFNTAEDSKWLVLTQWKGYRGGSPPLALEIRRDQLRLGGTEGSESLGRVRLGTWTHLTFGMRWSPDEEVGWVEVWRDGEQVVPRQAGATMTMVDGDPDPVYLKQGLYRSREWNSTHVVYFGPLTIATTLQEAVSSGEGARPS